MEDYIRDSLAAGIIRPSSSPVGAGFFFVGKKDGTLRPCIDFRGLNNITIKNKYPLPLIDSAFSPLHGARIFTKLDLRNAYHLIRVKEGDEWKQLQRFLGFANFYRRFIKNYSRLAAPLTALTSTSTLFRWTSEAEAAFQKLKGCFTSAPVLTQVDPELQFVMEVDASDTGVGAILSQRSPTDHKLHPCAFYSHKLSSAEKNYDVGNRELLAVKLALEEWRHWLEGAKLPFIVWTDHKNLAYIQTAKQLNSRQARWALFFGRFNFTLTYRPGSRNTKPDALSRQFTAESTPESDPVLSPTCIVASMTWDMYTSGPADPGNGPPNSLFVPDSVHSEVLQWAHSTRLPVISGWVAL